MKRRKVRQPTNRNRGRVVKGRDRPAPEPPLEQQIRAVPIPRGLFWLEGEKYRASGHITSVVAFLAKKRKDGGVLYLPFLIGWRTRHQGKPYYLEERVRQHVVRFQTMLKQGTAPFATEGGILDYHAGEPR